MNPDVKVEIVDRTEEFIVIEVSASGIPSKRISVHIDSIVDGKTTLEEQLELARQDGKKRLARFNAMNTILKVKRD